MMNYKQTQFIFFSFASNYKNRVWRNEVLMRKQERGIEERNASGKSLLYYLNMTNSVHIFRNVTTIG